MKRTLAWVKFLFFVALVAGIGVLAGFGLFVRSVINQEPPDTLVEADGVVVWTGKGGGRLNTGGDILVAGRAERLLISGVNPANGQDEIAELLALPDEIAACCVDLDYAAEDTVGNARETAAWANAMGYEHIILVTSAYHMPRAQVEIAATAGRMRITPWPVRDTDYVGWWRDAGQRKRLGQEYAKLLVSYFRDPAREDLRETPVVPLRP